MLHKSAPALVKATGPDDGLEPGQFRALVSVFGNVDSYGDRVVKGAFTDTLAEWKASGNPIPIYWSHRMDDPDYNIGYAVEADETEEGLEILGQIDLEDGSSSKAKQTYRLLKGRRVTQFSFAYDVLEAAWVNESAEDDDEKARKFGMAATDGFDIYELRKLKLYEVGPTPIGANQETELLAVKAAGEHTARFVASLKAGRVLSAKNESVLKDAQTQIAAAAEQLAEVLAQVASSENEEEPKTHPTQPAKDPAAEAKGEQPEELKQTTEEPTVIGPVDAYLSHIATRERLVRL
jgi:HK97 family phage prohead protease